jgi:hypothetical protein
VTLPRPGCAMSVWGRPESLSASSPPGAGGSTRMAYSRLTKRQWRGCLEGMQVYTCYCRRKPAHLDPGREVPAGEGHPWGSALHYRRRFACQLPSTSCRIHMSATRNRRPASNRGRTPSPGAHASHSSKPAQAKDPIHACIGEQRDKGHSASSGTSSASCIPVQYFR